MRTVRLTGAAVLGTLCLLVSAFAPAAAEPAALASGLRELAAAYDRGDPRLSAHLAIHITNRAGDPLVLVHLEPGADVNAALKQLAAAGFQLTTRSSINPALVEGYLPLAAVHAAAAVAGIRALHAQQRPVKHQALLPVLPPVKQAAVFEKASLANARGITGKGIRIGALSDSFDACPDPLCTDINGNPDHAAQDIASGALPAAGVTVLQEFDPSVNPGLTPTDEGRAILQLVHDIAPDAQLGFASAFNGELSFAENILALRAQFNADVICDDVSYSDEPMYSDGILAQAVDLVSHAGAAYFSSAGNNGLEAYESVYPPISFAAAQQLVAHGHGNVHLEQIPAAIRPLTVHNFNGGEDDRGAPSITQRFTTTFNQGITFQWDEPFFLGLVKTNYIVYVFDKDGNWMDPNSAAFPGFYTTDNALLTDTPNQFLFLPPFPTDFVGGANVTDYQLVIGKTNAGPARHIKYININGLGVSERQNASSTSGHPAARGARGVAAQYYAIPKFPEDFSSPGPVTIYLDTQGNRLDEPDVRFTPQITAADGIDTTFFGFDSDGDGYPNFFGTSAAAPDAAAVAGLVLQAAGGPGSLAPQRVYQRLEATATPIPVPNMRWIAGAFAGPLEFAASGDWTRWDRDFSVEVEDIGGHSVASIVLDSSPTGLVFNPNPNRFSVGATNGPGIADITHTVSGPGNTVFTMLFAPGKFTSGESFDFGESVFAPIQGSTQEDPDRFRGMKVTVTLDDGRHWTAPVVTLPKFPINNFAGFGLVNADAATR
jgi:hypothetical protein